MSEQRGDGARTDERNGELSRAISKWMLLVFVLGDILGTGIYALVGEVAGEVGGAIWAAFAFAIALALSRRSPMPSWLQSIRTPQGPALYMHRAFSLPFVT